MKKLLLLFLLLFFRADAELYFSISEYLNDLIRLYAQVSVLRGTIQDQIIDHELYIIEENIRHEIGKYHPELKNKNMKFTLICYDIPSIAK